MADSIDEILQVAKQGSVITAAPSLKAYGTGNPYAPLMDTTIQLYRPLVMDPAKFWQNYNLDIEDYVERHVAKEKAQSKGGQTSNDIRYLSYSHAFKLFRANHPGWEVDVAVNPRTGGPIFEEIDRRGYFIKAFIHDGESRSAAYYNAILTMSGLGMHPDEVAVEYVDNKPRPKKSPTGDFVWKVDSQLINKAVYRAMVKAIGLFTGIGLKLWTGDDLSEEILDAKMALVSNVQKLAQQYTILTGKEFEGAASLNYTSTEGEIKHIGRNVQQALQELRAAQTTASPEAPADKVEKSGKSKASTATAGKADKAEDVKEVELVTK